MSKTLNINTFNEIIFGAFKDQSPRAKAELLQMEIQAAYSMKVQQMEEVIEDLNEGRPYHKNLQLVNNIDGNVDVLAEQLDELLKEHPEIKEEMEDDHE